MSSRMLTAALGALSLTLSLSALAKDPGEEDD